MYLYIRVIALILLIPSNLRRSHQGTHTYRLSKLLKIIYLQLSSLQQRSKIMNQTFFPVKLILNFFSNTPAKLQL